MSPLCRNLLLTLLISGAHPSPAEEPAATSLSSALRAQKEKPAVNAPAVLLRPQWLGDFKEPDQPLARVRFESVSVRFGELLLEDRSPGSRGDGDTLSFLPRLPSDEEIRDAATLEKLQQLLGKGFPGITGETEGDKRFGSHSWSVFTAISEKELLALKVFVHTVFVPGTSAGQEGITGSSIFRTTLRPARDDDPDELRLYPTSARREEDLQKRNSAFREKFPEPLRSLLKAQDLGTDGKFLTAAIRQFRHKPDLRLFPQIVAAIPENPDRFTGLFRQILDDSRPSIYQPRWQDVPKRDAILKSIEALPAAPPSSRRALIGTLLLALGGGSVTFTDESSGYRCEIALTRDGHTSTLGSLKENPSIEETCRQLKALVPPP